MNLDEIRQILELVREHELSELELERDGLKIRVRKAAGDPAVVPQGYAAPAGRPSAPVSASLTQEVAEIPPEPEPDTAEDLAIIKSPIVGTFYRAPEPGSPPFVDVGQTVKKGQVLCIIEAMKLMNEIDSDCDGEVAAVYVESGRPVQYGERLFAIRVL